MTSLRITLFWWVVLVFCPFLHSVQADRTKDHEAALFTFGDVLALDPMRIGTRTELPRHRGTLLYRGDSNGVPEDSLNDLLSVTTVSISSNRSEWYVDGVQRESPPRQRGPSGIIYCRDEGSVGYEHGVTSKVTVHVKGSYRADRTKKNLDQSTSPKGRNKVIIGSLGLRTQLTDSAAFTLSAESLRGSSAPSTSDSNAQRLLGTFTGTF